MCRVSRESNVPKTTIVTLLPRSPEQVPQGPY
jgi:hypothetical protein